MFSTACSTENLKSKFSVMAALCLITVSAILFIIAADSPGRDSRKLIQSSADSRLIVRLPENVSRLSYLLAIQRDLDKNAKNPREAGKLARLSLQQYQASGNARFLGAAKAALVPWATLQQPPLPVWLIRSRILQAEHQFDRAAKDLAELNTRYPNNIEALLLEADAWRRAGQIEHAKKVCLKLAFAGRLDLTTFCTAEIMMSLGQVEHANTLLRDNISETAKLPLTERNWANAIYADSLLAIGELDAAGQVWRSILQPENNQLNARLAYADLLLVRSEWAVVLDLLIDDSATTAALLRLAIASKNIGDPVFTQIHNRLNNRFQLADQSPSADLYLRDRAIYELGIMQNPDQALTYALQNWQYQKAWEDAELVLQIASLVNDDSAIQTINQWRQRWIRGDRKWLGK